MSEGRGKNTRVHLLCYPGLFISSLSCCLLSTGSFGFCVYIYRVPPAAKEHPDSCQPPFTSVSFVVKLSLVIFHSQRLSSNIVLWPVTRQSVIASVWCLHEPARPSIVVAVVVIRASPCLLLIAPRHHSPSRLCQQQSCPWDG